MLFRNYSTPQDVSEEDASENTVILEAARAISAAPSYFTTAEVDGVKYCDGGLENNNLIEKVWMERAPIRTSCIESLGTVVPAASKPKRFVPDVIQKSAQILSTLTKV